MRKLNGDDIQKNMETPISKKAENSREFKKTGLGAAVLVSAALGLGACQPNVTINNIPYDPNAPDASTTCAVTCDAITVTLRDAGNTAGTNSATIGEVTVAFNGLDSQGSVKLAKIDLNGCGHDASASLPPGTTPTRLTLGLDSYDVTVESMDYDAAGLRVVVTVQPVCPGQSKDGGVSDGGSGA